MRILLTGASGEIGTPLIDRLASLGHELHVISRRAHRSRRTECAATPPADHTVRWIHADVTNLDSLRLASQCEPELVIHMAAVTHSAQPAAYETTNVQGTKNLLIALSTCPPRRFIHLSTRAIGTAGGAYAESKARAEQAVQESDLAWTILRPAEVYGSGGSDPILSLAADLRRRRFVPILGDGSYRLAPVYAADVIEAIVHAIEQPEAAAKPEQTYVLAGPEDLSYLELVEKLETIQGLPRRWRIPVPVLPAVLAIRCLAALGLGNYVPDQIPRLLLPKSSDRSAAERDLQFTPRSLEQVLPHLLPTAPPGLDASLGTKPE